MEHMLEKVGATQVRPNKYISPNSQSGSAGLIVFPRPENDYDLVYSHHASDGDLANRAVDAFELFSHYLHGGDKDAALKDAANLIKAIDPKTSEQLDQTVAEYNLEKRRKDLKPIPIPKPQDLAKPFPIEQVPPCLRSAAEEISRSVPFALDGCVAAALLVVSTALGRGVRLEEKPHLFHNCSIGLFGIAETGERKSAAFSLLTKPLADRQKKLGEQWGVEKKLVASHNRLIENRIAKIEKDSQKNLTVENIELLAGKIDELSQGLKDCGPRPLLYSTDATAEAIIKSLHQQGGETAIFSADARNAVDNILGKYSSTDTDESVYIHALTGDDIISVRAGRDEPYIILNPCMNFCAFVQPDKARQLLENDSMRESGFLARMLMVRSLPLIGTRMEGGKAGMDMTKIQPFYDHITSLLEGKSACDGPVIMSIEGNPETKALREAYHDRIEAEMAAGGKYEDHRSVINKLTTVSVKIAACLEAMYLPGLFSQGVTNIRPEIYSCATVIADYLADSTVYVHSQAVEDLLLIKAELLRQEVARGLSIRRDEHGIIHAPRYPDGHIKSIGYLKRDIKKSLSRDGILEKLIPILEKYNWLIPDGKKGWYIKLE